MSRGRPVPRGIELLHDPRWNKSTAFTEAERDALGIRGLLPPRVFTIEEQQQRVMENFERKESDLERYIFLLSLQDRNETLFYRTLTDHIVRMLPIVYTPTVGEACRQFGHIFRRPRGLYLSARDRGRMAQVLRNWPADAVSVVVVTDGERILGLGDLGAYGMGIPIGKLALYTACGGIHPDDCLPVMLDVGTDNPALREDPLYTGLLQPRIRGAEYLALVDEFMDAVAARYPRALVQFEDFATANAQQLLARYRDRACMFNDDIQGTAAVALAVILAALRQGPPRRLRDERILFLGAGAAATGIADLLVEAMVADGLAEAEARRRCWMVDRHGLVVEGDPRVHQGAAAYAHRHPAVATLLEAVQSLRPTVLIGASGAAGSFTRPVIEAMTEATGAPLILALSNPTSHSECTAADAYRWSQGRALFASGSPFPPVEVAGTIRAPAQANNAYIFPAIGLAVAVSGASRVTAAMFHAAAEMLAGLAGPEEVRCGALLPPLSGIREVSARLATAIAAVAFESGLATRPRPDDLAGAIHQAMYVPAYQSYV